ncbi:hypothetical protein VNO77_03035 [Canavalia gladiata]|uniref:Uncharacterized protein n=1 Tax=Canavalia gladiata TaxID=3824 RepID=A0AAN9MZ81_CANGL
MKIYEEGKKGVCGFWILKKSFRGFLSTWHLLTLLPEDCRRGGKASIRAIHIGTKEDSYRRRKNIAPAIFSIGVSAPAGRGMQPKES